MPKTKSPKRNRNTGIIIPLIQSCEKIYKKYWTEKWTPRSKNGMSVKYFTFNKHYFKTIKEAREEILKLGSRNGTYYAILKVMKDGGEVFTFVSADCNSSILRPADLEGLNIVKFMGSFPELWFSI